MVAPFLERCTTVDHVGTGLQPQLRPASLGKIALLIGFPGKTKPPRKAVGGGAAKVALTKLNLATSSVQRIFKARQVYSGDFRLNIFGAVFIHKLMLSAHDAMKRAGRDK